MVVASARLDGPVRDGEIVRADNDGAGPYLVRWADSGRETLFFPGPDAHVEHPDHEPEPGTDMAEPGPPATSAHVREWHVDLYLYESEESTSASAVLRSEVPDALRSSGTARRRPGEPDVPEIGDEVAVARALHRLAEVMLSTAESDLAEIEGHDVSLTM
jgi:hypothetical protein